MESVTAVAVVANVLCSSIQHRLKQEACNLRKNEVIQLNKALSYQQLKITKTKERDKIKKAAS